MAESAWGLGTVLIAGSLFFFSPQGLPAFVTSLGTFLRGWWTPAGVPLWQLLLALPAYEILPLALALPEPVRGIMKRDPEGASPGDWGRRWRCSWPGLSR